MVSDFCFIFKEAFVDSGNAPMFMKTASTDYCLDSFFWATRFFVFIFSYFFRFCAVR